MKIECSLEAGETYQGLVSHLCGYCVDVVPDGEERAKTVYLVGPDYNDGDYSSLRVKDWDEDESGPIGEEYTLLVSSVYVH